MSPRIGLTLPKIVETAAEIADTNGIQEVTLASVAQRLGIRSPSLYNHVKGYKMYGNILVFTESNSCITEWKKLLRVNVRTKQFMH